MRELDRLLTDLADDIDDYQREGSTVLLTRQGREYSLEVRSVPGAGLTVRGTSDTGDIQEEPLRTFAQRVLLDLPRLSSQVRRTLDRSRTGELDVGYVDGPAEYSAPDKTITWSSPSTEFLELLSEQEAGTTRLIQLMAGAGQGKTVLLECIAKLSASRYTADPYPTPFLLLVDLLGRYVGTVDDAIAGSLNNTYKFPGLTQRDVALCIRNNWLILALDGFDELVARVGAQDAFNRITELLDQLHGSGTVILSARESFFELHQITSAIRSYLQPRHGSYSTSILRLLPWSDEQGRRVFEAIKSSAPNDDLAALLATFGDDREIVLQPFLLTKLALLWKKGERFAAAPRIADHRARTDYIIGTFIEREARSKWVDREERPLLTVEQHTALLAGIAEEMWRSGAFRMGEEELQIAAEIAISDLGLPPVVGEGVVERVGTHAALVRRDRSYSFLHDRFLHYYVAQRLVRVFGSPMESANNILSARELPPDVIGWIDWFLRDEATTRERVALECMALIEAGGQSQAIEQNVAQLIGMLLHGRDNPFTVKDLSFVGESLCRRRYENVTFVRCRFWQLDMSGSTFRNCSFEECQFGETRINNQTSLESTSFKDTQIRAFETDDDRMLFDPESIGRLLKARGAVISTSVRPKPGERLPAINGEIIDAISRLVRKSQQACDISRDEVQRLFENDRQFIRIGVDTDVLRPHQKSTSGPRKEFVRFNVDRQLLMRGQTELTGDTRIDAFWRELGRAFPAKPANEG